MIDDFNDDVFLEEESEDNINEIPKELRKLRTQPYDKSIIDLVNMIDRKEICLDPDFQRNYVWDNKRASLLVESIWLNIPIPQIFVSVEEDGMWNVIDGQQRLTSLYKFFKNDFTLRGLSVLPELNGKRYSTLEDKPKRLLNGGNIRIVALHEDSHPDIKFDVFMRINQGAVQLNAQELRNCLYRGNLNKNLHEIVKNPNLLKILNLSKPHPRFNDIELLLRYLALTEKYESDLQDYPNNMKLFVNDFMRRNRNANDDEIKNIRDKINQSIEKVYFLFGNNAFRRWLPESKIFDKKLNLSIMDCQMIACERYDFEKIINNKEVLIDSFKNLFNDTTFSGSITEGTSAKKNILFRIQKTLEIFDYILG